MTDRSTEYLTTDEPALRSMLKTKGQKLLTKVKNKYETEDDYLQARAEGAFKIVDNLDNV